MQEHRTDSETEKMTDVETDRGTDAETDAVKEEHVIVKEDREKKERRKWMDRVTWLLEMSWLVLLVASLLLNCIILALPSWAAAETTTTIRIDNSSSDDPSTHFLSVGLWESCCSNWTCNDSTHTCSSSEHICSPLNQSSMPDWFHGLQTVTLMSCVSMTLASLMLMLLLFVFERFYHRLICGVFFFSFLAGLSLAVDLALFVTSDKVSLITVVNNAVSCRSCEYSGWGDAPIILIVSLSLTVLSLMLQITIRKLNQIRSERFKYERLPSIEETTGNSSSVN